ncbi:TIGR02147 family protein [bacterium]|nr:TIGR02147 family protein [bacterium]
MKSQSVFEFDAYKKYMESRLYGAEKRGQLSRAAEALNCQASFLSRVIHAEVHLTPDHAYLLSEFWHLDSNESNYFQTLVHWERASHPKLKAALNRQLSELKDKHESLQSRVKKPEFALSELQANYFSSWHWSLLHFLVSIPEFQSLRALSDRMSMPEYILSKYLEKLAEGGLVRENNGRWEYAGGQFHLPKTSPFVTFHHRNWRDRAMIDAQNPDNQSVHYTSVLTLSRKDLGRLKELILNFISESHALSKPSSPEECAVLTCDLFVP